MDFIKRFDRNMVPLSSYIFEPIYCGKAGLTRILQTNKHYRKIMTSYRIGVTEHDYIIL